MLAALLDGEKLDHRGIPIAGWTRENFTADEEETGNQFRFVLPGPQLSAEEWQHCLDPIAATEPRPEYLVASGSGQLARRTRLGLRLHPRGVEKSDEGEGQQDEQEDHPGHQHDDGKDASEVAGKG